MKVKNIHFYQAFAVKKLALRHTPDINELLTIGDLAILELSAALLGVTTFPKLHQGPAKRGDKLWVGGFGKRGLKFNHIDVSQFGYQGSFALLEKRWDSINFEVNNLKMANKGLIHHEK